MTKEEILIELAKILKEDDILKASGLHEENFRPHPFTIGKKHEIASDENDGVMTEEICKRFPCKAKGCNLSYEDHDSDKQLVLQLKRDVMQTEVNEQLLKMRAKIKELGINTIAFADTEEGYKFLV